APVSSFFASTLALATTAPDASTTVPLIDDVLTCAEREGTPKSNTNRIKTACFLVMEHPHLLPAECARSVQARAISSRTWQTAELLDFYSAKSISSTPGFRGRSC